MIPGDDGVYGDDVVPAGRAPGSVSS